MGTPSSAATWVPAGQPGTEAPLLNPMEYQEELLMRKAAMLVLFALLAVAIVFAQNPGSTNTNSNPTTSPQTQNSNPTTSPQTQNSNPSTPNPDQNATAPASATGNQ